MWRWIVLVIIAIALYIWWFKPLGKSSTKEIPLELSKSPEVGTTAASQTVLLKSNTGTLQAFVYPLAYERTGQLTMCSSSTPAAPGEPDCATGRFSMCVCEGGSCDKCKHTGYVNVLNISNIVRVELLTAPDASRQNMAGSQLVVRTMRNPMPPSAKQGRCPKGYYQFTKDGGEFCCPVEPTYNGTRCPVPAMDTKQVCALDSTKTDGKPMCPQQMPEQGTIIQEETLVLPNLPFQKWTMITIARDGRRFDVYYNAQLVLSKRTQYMLASTTAFGPVIAGDPNLSGKVSTVKVFPDKKSSAEISQMYAAQSDTNGAPYVYNSVDLTNYIPSCEGGKCLKGPVVRPASPLMDWETEYA